MNAPVPALAERAQACAAPLRDADEVLVVSHIDADGLTSAAIAVVSLIREGISVKAVFEKQLDGNVLARIASTSYDTVLFTDFGSGQLSEIHRFEEQGEFTPVVVDHHHPDPTETPYHLNPLLEGINGASELSGAGSAYVLARELSGDNRDLAGLAVVGAVGDMQATTGGLIGANEAIVEEGVTSEVIETGQDLALYGKQTRPLPKLLEYASDISIPGISNNQRGATAFFDDVGIDVRENGEWRTWTDLSIDERQTVVSGLVRRGIERGVAPKRINRLIGTTYELAEETVGTELRDASEFSTLLNATARYDRPDVGLAVALGDRDGAFTKARELLTGHRRNLSDGLEVVKENGVTNAEHIQWFHAGDRIRETIVGIVAGMAIGVSGVDANRPIIAFANADDGVKVSARGTATLVRKGLDLSVVMRDAATAVGGEGGGHDIAAGATIPAGNENEFIETADGCVGAQLTE